VDKPQIGHLVLIRRRPAIIRQIEIKKGTNTSEKDRDLHFVSLEYLDSWDFPNEDHLLWERERNTKILSNIEFPPIESKICDNPQIFKSYINGIKWSSLSQFYNTKNFRETNSSTFTRIFSPWRSAIKIEDYQLVPLIKAMNMHRVRLLLADGVGMGKTIQAGLITTELIHQRKFRKILIICPSPLQYQWKNEMNDKFNLKFTILDKNEVIKIKNRLGIDTNPWRTIPKIITSMDYLKQIDVINKFELSARVRANTTRPVWNLLIVDEAHHFSPTAFDTENSRIKMLKKVSKWFEHRLFLTATPHNGRIESYTGLLELLDPVKFRTSLYINDQMRLHIQNVVIRRLKSELIDTKGNLYFSTRKVDTINLKLQNWEREFYSLIYQYRRVLHDCHSDDKLVRVHNFIFILLIKRLLSSPYAFAYSWWIHIQSLNKKDINEKTPIITYNEVLIAINRTIDVELLDEQRERYEHTALSLAIRLYALNTSENQKIKNIRNTISNMLTSSGFGKEILEIENKDLQFSMHDSKIISLEKWINNHLMTNGEFKEDERVLIYTDNTYTQTYIFNTLRDKMKLTSSEVETLSETSKQLDQNLLAKDFNDINSRLKILISTDTASEGLNLQNMCRYIIHYDIPWNPFKLEQRNGRIDRHGQTRDVHLFHFNSTQNKDIHLLSRVATKISTSVDGLGSIGEILENIIQNHFENQNYTTYNIEALQNNDEMYTTDKEKRNNESRLVRNDYAHSLVELGITSEAIANLFITTFEQSGGKIEMISPTQLLIRKIPRTWEKLVENTFRPVNDKLPILAFDYKDLMQNEFGREIFLNHSNKQFITISHPFMLKSLNSMKKLLWNEMFHQNGISKWKIKENKFYPSHLLEINIIFTIRNELGETFHSEFHSYFFEINEDSLNPIQSTNNIIEAVKKDCNNIHLQMEYVSFCRKLWTIHKNKLIKVLDITKQEEVNRINKDLPNILNIELQKERESFERAKNDIISQKSDKGYRDLLNQIEQKKILFKKNNLVHELHKYRAKELSDLESKINDTNWRNKYEDNLNSILEIITLDHEKMINEILPKRYSSKDSIEFHPVSVLFHLNIAELGEI